MLTILFYSTNGAAAKARSREIAAVKGDYARVIDVGFWDESVMKCDLVEVMPDVPKWQRNRITNVFGEIQEAPEVDVKEAEPARTKMGLMPAREAAPELPNPAASQKIATHKGGGRWFVMVGEERISGPHDKAEAMRLAQEV